MAASIRRIIWNTRERIVSTDFNDSVNLTNRAIIEALAASNGHRGGVVYGMESTITGSGLDVTVSPGLALIDAGAASGDDSEFSWVELTSSETVTLTAADGANPRWDVVEIAATEGVELSSLRDVFNPALGTFTPQTLVKRRTSEPALSVRAGTAAASPQFPSGVAGVIPLAYIYVPASAVNLTVDNEVLCRPVLGGGEDDATVYGGGVDVETAGNDITLKPAHGRFPSSHFRWDVPGGSVMTLSTSNFTGGALPVADDVIYWYAVPAPYPAGYDTTLAPREFSPQAAAATLFPSSAPGIRGCVIVGSIREPVTTSRQGEPGVALPAMPDTNFGAAAVLDSANATYLGATTWDVSLPALLNQRSTGDWVTGFEGGSIGIRSSITLPGSATDISVRTGGTVPLPVTTNLVNGRVGITGTSGETGTATVADVASNSTFFLTVPPPAATDGVALGLFRPDPAGELDLRFQVGAGAPTGTLVILAYQDAILASR